MYQVVLSAEDGEYVQAEFPTMAGANAYLAANAWHYGDGQELFIRKVSRYFN